MLYILYRTTTSYACDDLILGIFENKNMAVCARNQYIQETKRNDPYKDEPYENVRNLDENVHIREVRVTDLHKKLGEIRKEFGTKEITVNFVNHVPRTVYIILRSSYGMGQKYRDFVGLYEMEVDFNKGLEEAKTYQKANNYPLNFIETEKLFMNTLRYHNSTRRLE